MNEKSSRSHSVLSCFIESKSLGDGMLSERFSTFHIIDLAGSESNKSSMAEGVRLKESGMINKSLSALGLVIKTLSERKSWQAKHVPYRSSKLTFILKNSLGGNSKTLVIANVSPSWSHLSETLSTLDFAKRAKLMKNEAQVNDSTTINVRSLQNEIMKLKS
jgi:kinesin family member 15